MQEQQLDFDEQDYPQSLKQLTNAPVKLYYQGNSALLKEFNKNISIVGTRTASIYGKTCTQMLVKALSAYNAVIVSGMAYGIDTTAHEAAIEYGLPDHRSAWRAA
jgi:DNA processing protein